MTRDHRFDDTANARGAGRKQHETIDEGAAGADGAAAPGMEPADAPVLPDTDAGADDLLGTLEAQKDKYLRLAAEFENFKRRTSRERLEAGSRAQAELASALLEPLDDLARFVTAGHTSDVASLVQGVELVSRKLMKSLAAAGLEMIDPADQIFDPAVHEAVSTRPAASPAEDDLVGEVFQPGYVLKGQLLRPARVVVKKWNG